VFSAKVLILGYTLPPSSHHSISQDVACMHPLSLCPYWLLSRHALFSCFLAGKRTVGETKLHPFPHPHVSLPASSSGNVASMSFKLESILQPVIGGLTSSTCRPPLAHAPHALASRSVAQRNPIGLFSLANTVKSIYCTSQYSVRILPAPDCRSYEPESGSSAARAQSWSWLARTCA
jgi:hypothetical protein